MPELPEAIPPKNHNNPPSELEYLQSNLELRHIAAFQAADKHIALAARIPQQFTADNEANYAADYIKLVQACQKDMEKARKEEKEPFLRQGQFVDVFFGEMVKKLDAAVATAKRPLNDYLQRKAYAEQERRNAEAAAMRREQEEAMIAAAAMRRTEMQAAEVTQTIDHAVAMTQVADIAEKIAAAPVVSMARAEGQYSAANLKKKMVGRIIDIETLDLGKLRPYFLQSDLQKALDKFVKSGGKLLDGAKIEETIEVGVK